MSKSSRSIIGVDEIIWRYAGILGLNPDPFTLRELTWMVEGRGEFEWSMTAHQMALQINMKRKKGAKAISPSILNPFMKTPKKKAMLSVNDTMDILRKVFINDQK